jgi:hypothetical protein
MSAAVPLLQKVLAPTSPHPLYTLSGGPANCRKPLEAGAGAGRGWDSLGLSGLLSSMAPSGVEVASCREQVELFPSTVLSLADMPHLSAVTKYCKGAACKEIWQQKQCSPGQARVCRHGPQSTGSLAWAGAWWRSMGGSEKCGWTTFSLFG